MDLGNVIAIMEGNVPVPASRKSAKSREQKKKEAKSRDPFKRAVVALATARHELQEASGSLELKQQLFDKNNASLLQRVEAAKLAVEMNDGTLRQYLVGRHEETGETAFGPGIEIKTRMTLELIDRDKLLSWALKNGRFLLELNMQRVNLVAKALPGVLPGIIDVEVPTPYIAKDLDKVIEVMWNE